MKFLRLAFYVLIAQLVLSGCAGEAVEETSSSSASEINFDAYVGRNASTRSSITDIDFLKKDLDDAYNAGFGVFAIYSYLFTHRNLIYFCCFLLCVVKIAIFFKCPYLKVRIFKLLLQLSININDL